MAKCKRSSRRPQARHKKQKKSQYDKRQRLERRNHQRKKTVSVSKIRAEESADSEQPS